jgi:predicted XRE-type DNA-binding protein
MELETVSKRRRKVSSGSGNVFADLGFPDSFTALAKAELASRLIGIVADKSLTQTEAADILGVDQPRVSDLKRGRLAQFTLDRLIRFLNALGHDVEIVVKPRARKSTRAAIHVVSSKRTTRKTA